MDAKKWQHVKAVLAAALEVPQAGREAFLSEHCNGDAELREEVRALLAAEDSAERFEVSPVGSVFADREVDAAVGNSYIGRVVGKYRIVRAIGVGGMGSVFLAERADGEFAQTVAIKLIKTGIVSDAVLQRFLNERQILASLEHPNIARLIDGGSTEDGSPYFVMEYVEGLPINEYADVHGLGLDERLDLFRRVCGAVAFAHRNLVIHRDLKPSNILVTQDGKPKLLDFGIAKLADPERSGEAPTRQFAFTPEYASPEQILGENLTTATDIYSLGVILFELLTGRRPFLRDGSVGKIIRSAATMAPRPSLTVREAAENAVHTEFRSRLRGDLDNIILKALTQEPDRRYTSVEQFADDLRRYLKGMPVLARADTFRYRVRKFASRNPLVVGSAALGLLILISGIIATGYQARRADRERAKAQQRFNDVRALANSFIFEVNEKIDESPIKARELVVTRALEYLDRLAAESAGDAGLQAELAAGYEKIGDLQAEIFKPNLGNAGGALESHRKVLQLRQSLVDADGSDPARILDLARSRQKVGSILMVTGDISAAAEMYRTAIAQASDVADASVAARRQMRSLYLSLGQSILRSGSLSECVSAYLKAFEINEDLLRDDPDRSDPVRAKFIILNYLGYARLLLGDNAAALRDLEESLALALRLLSEAPSDLRAERAVVSGYLFLGIGQRDTGYIGEALGNLRESLKRQSRIYKLDLHNMGERNALADCYLELGAAEAKARRTASAMRSLKAALEHYAAVSANDPNDLAVRRQIVLVRRRMAEAESAGGRFGPALEYILDALAGAEELVRRDPKNLEWKHDLAASHLAAAALLKRRGDLPAAEHRDKAIWLLDALVTSSPENLEFVRQLNEARSL